MTKGKTVEGRGDDRQSKVEGLVEATGKSPEPAGRNACPTVQKVAEPAERRAPEDLAVGHANAEAGFEATCHRSPNDGGRRARSDAPYLNDERAELLAVLERFNISLVAFEGLRCDSYEKHLARRSLVELEAFYHTLLKPGVGYDRIREGCPPWQGGEHNGKLPTPKTLRDIKNRILAERAVDKLEANDHFLKVFLARMKGLPAERQAVLYDTILELLGNELISATLEGKPLLDNLKGVDRIMKAKAMATRAEQGERRLKIREGGLRIREQRLADDRQRMQKTVEGQSNAEGGVRSAEETQQNEAEGEYDPEAMDETDIMLEKVFGKNPFKNQPPGGTNLKTSTTEPMIDGTGPN